MRTYFFIFIILYLIANLVTVILYKADKVKAVKKSWRIKEKVLLSFGFFFGAFGALFAMHTFRHKTKHWYFWLANILGLIWQSALIVYLMLHYIL